MDRYVDPVALAVERDKERINNERWKLAKLAAEYGIIGKGDVRNTYDNLLFSDSVGMKNLRERINEVIVKKFWDGTLVEPDTKPANPTPVKRIETRDQTKSFRSGSSLGLTNKVNDWINNQPIALSNFEVVSIDFSNDMNMAEFVAFIHYRYTVEVEV